MLKHPHTPDTPKFDGSFSEVVMNEKIGEDVAYTNGGFLKQDSDKSLPPVEINDGPDSESVKMQETKIQNETDDNHHVIADESVNNDMNGVIQNGKIMDSHLNFSNGNIPQQSPSHVRTTKEPLAFCAMIIKRPILSYCLLLGAHILMILITMILLRAGYNILPLEFSRLPLNIDNDIDYRRGLAWQAKTLPVNPDEVSVATEKKERSQITDYLDLMFEKPGGNVFTKENFETIKRIQEEIFNMTSFQDDYCFLIYLPDNSSRCSPPTSIIQYFDGQIAARYSDFRYYDPNFLNIPGILGLANSDPRLKKGLQGFLGRYSEINATTNVAQSSITKVTLFFGGPLVGYKNTSHLKDEQSDKRNKFFKDVSKKLEDWFLNGIDGLDFMYMGGGVMSTGISGQAMSDMMLVIGSLVFIFLFMVIQTGSFWITGWAIFSIIACFFTTNLIYRIVLDFQYLGVFHILSVFIILGIGADDVFVFYDTWKECGHRKYPSVAHRLSDCYRRASAAMFFTSATTAVAFFVSGASQLLGVSSFGIFSGILVIVNYISVITFFPTVVVTYHLYWEKFKCCCCCLRDGSAEDVDSTTNVPKIGNRKNPIVRFFRGPYFSFISHKIIKWMVIAGSLVVLGVFAYFAAQLKPNEEQVEFVSKKTNIGKALDKRATAFKEVSRSQVSVYIIWGLDMNDMSSCHKTDYSCQGTTTWDGTFDMNPPPVQMALLEFCQKLKTELTAQQIEDLKIARDIVTNDLEIACFIDDMATFMQNEGNLTINGTQKYPSGSNFTLPTSELKIRDLMTNNPLIYNMASLSPYFYRYFEIAMDYWMTNGYSPLYSGESQYTTYSKLTGSSELGGGHSYPITGSNLKYGRHLRYAAIKINTTLQGNTLGYPNGLPVRDKWEAFITDELSAMPRQLQGGFQTTPTGFNTWHWLKVQRMLATSAVNGIIIGVCIAYPILLIATKNFLTAFYAVLTICFIAVSVVGVLPMGGWKLGVLESLNLVLVVGLSVDYVVHLAEGYSRSLRVDRLGRVREMLDQVGISVLSGACTTLGASVFMFFAVILFFTQFGIFMFCTIGFSIFYSLMFFVATLSAVGPEDEFGSILPIGRWIKRKWKGRNEVDVDCETCDGKGFHKPYGEELPIA